MKILFVGGTWDKKGGKPSGMVLKMFHALEKLNQHKITFYNGGEYDSLKGILQTSSLYDSVWWFANVPNNLPKVRDVKETAPFVMLVTSKRNDNHKYTDMDIIQRALASKSNLIIEFSKIEEKKFHIRVMDPLGSLWADTNDIETAIKQTSDRLAYLKNITRQHTEKSDMSNGLVLSWYFDNFKTPENRSNKIITIPDRSNFIKVIHEYANDMQTRIMPMSKDTARFLGNASLKLPPQNGRCSKTFPSFLENNMIFVSKRNVPKQFIEMDDFVPVYIENDKLYYCGDNKPSVDTPVQIKLYKNLPNIKYMIHFHAYVENAPFTNKAVPCGALDEINEVLGLIDEYYKDRNRTDYAINLKGHGAIIMSDTVEKLMNYTLTKRNIPEKMF